ncbi:MAG: hypothetical protein ACI9NN_001983, partial [Bacteroidia bacterium]
PIIYCLAKPVDKTFNPSMINLNIKKHLLLCIVVLLQPLGYE